MAKIEKKMIGFLKEEHELQICEKLFQNIVFFLHVVLSKHCKYIPVFLAGLL